MRRFSKFATEAAKSLLTRLATSANATSYRDVMKRMGSELGELAARELGAAGKCLVICTNEDADFLARGLLDSLATQGFNDVHLACFWNERVRNSIDLAPILRSYIEPTSHVDTFIVVKSIISSACVVRTNIMELVYKQEPTRILVVAPVLLRGAQQRLEEDFPTEITRRFSYLWFAQEDKSNPDGTVVPGIGGSVYERLGIGTSETKNAYVPQLVKERRRQFRPSSATS